MTDFTQHPQLKEAILLASNYCGSAEKCLFDVRKKLDQWHIEPELHDLVCQYLVEERFVDEQRFAQSFVNDKFKFNQWGRIKISYSLRQKQIPSSIIQEALAIAIDEEEYRETLKSLAEKKLPKVKGKSDYEIQQKTAQYLSSRGFETNLIFDVLEDL